MGYTTSPSKILLGLGSSSISDIHFAYGQNDKRIDAYQNMINKGDWAIVKGHVQTEEDIQTGEIILDLICNQKAEIPFSFREKLGSDQVENLRQMEWDGLLTWEGNVLKVSREGIALVRNICMQVDLRLVKTQSKVMAFSKSI
jgi:oxygen-independent coproporphyrinogen-3 oxidase